MEKSLSSKQQSIIPIAAYTARGELQHLKSALNNGLNAGLTVTSTRYKKFSFTHTHIVGSRVVFVD